MKELKTGQIIRFKAISVLAAKEMEYEGTVLGNATAVRKMWPIEMGELEGICYLVRREDNFGNDFHHAVFPEEIL